VPANDPASLRAAVSSSTAAIIVEPIQGEGGVHLLTPAFAAAISDACARTGALLIADEVQSGLGRTGYPFYSGAIGLKPDLVSIGKALGGGVPIGAALLSEEVALAIRFGDHGSTYGGNLLACRAALCVLDALVGGGLLANIGRVGRHVGQRLDAIAAAHPIVKQVRGAGLIWGLELHRDAGPVVPAALVARRRRQPERRRRCATAPAAGHHGRGSGRRIDAAGLRRWVWSKRTEPPHDDGSRRHVCRSAPAMTPPQPAAASPRRRASGPRRVGAGIKRANPAGAGQPWRRPARPGAAGLGRAGDRIGGVHHQPRPGRAGGGVSLQHLAQSRGIARAIIVNSGCANACTGDEGMLAARDMAGETARLVACRSNRCWSPQPA
jgi:hypothetical protein